MDFNKVVNDVLNNSYMQMSRSNIQHGDVSVFAHCCAVAIICYVIAKKLKKFQINSLVRGALLHDFFLYDWHTVKLQKLHGFHHPEIAKKNSIDIFEVNQLEQNIISSHMWPLTITKLPRYRESWLVCLVDKFCSLMETLKIFRYDDSIFQLFDHDPKGLRELRKKYKLIQNNNKKENVA